MHFVPLFLANHESLVLKRSIVVAVNYADVVLDFAVACNFIQVYALHSDSFFPHHHATFSLSSVGSHFSSPHHITILSRG
ncbi:hypothetical protein SADUNF_Sadunf08G0052100 [Salix dunnii]|uniref:Uncharacterized protein n=1 Tax=Salix dunnii TaxID=1413687 RepID=A0A835JYI5_9ROSI|nr:hypothetical protein SADUNF_Sadunf08G0052100 [Salix dunnii]